MSAFLDANVILPRREIVKLIESEVVGDTGFEPVTSTVCKKHKRKKKQRK